MARRSERVGRSEALEARSLSPTPSGGRSSASSAPWEGRSTPRGGRARVGLGRRGLGGVHVGLLLRLHDVLLVADALVAEPVAHLEMRGWG